MAKCEKILIAGFSGAGKSSFLKELEKSAPDSSWTFNDLDLLVVKNHRSQEIASLIAEHGWEKFRLWERQTLESWLKEEGKGVLSLGGGALSSSVLSLYANHPKVKICYLHCSFEECWRRLQLPLGAIRPLVNLGKGELHRIYLERQKIFDQVPWRINNDYGCNLKMLAERLWAQIV